MDKPLALSETRRPTRCLSCGTTENMGRRRYCSIECRQRLRAKLDMRTGLIQALNGRYATFYFSDTMIIMDILPYGSREIFSFFYPRTPGKNPGDDFSKMANLLGDIWWTEKRRTRKRYLASHHLLEQAMRSQAPTESVRPSQVNIPAVSGSALVLLKLTPGDLGSRELKRVVKDAYRRQAMLHHPDRGGHNEAFLKIHQAYRELSEWADYPTFVKRRGVPDKWFFDGDRNHWLQPIRDHLSPVGR